MHHKKSKRKRHTLELEREKNLRRRQTLPAARRFQVLPLAWFTK
jgi:hypothetical protein